MGGPEQIQQTVQIVSEGFNLLKDFALPIGVGVCVTVISAIILYFLKKYFRPKK